MTKKPRQRTRAIWDDQKSARREDLIDAAARLFARGELQDISVQDVCAEAGLAKGTFYLYFTTKESIFLALHGRLVDAWAAELTRRLRALPAGAPASGLVRVFLEVFQRDAILLRLLPLLQSILEVNVTPEEIAAYKLALFEHQKVHIAEVSRLLPKLSAEEVAFFLVTCTTMMISTWQLAHPPPNVQKALAASGLSQWQFDFDALAGRQLTTLLAGLGVRHRA